mmetsp:Transcript_30398/g.78614  ORF Transcript_30398/g.78614 Transcript_30398/m.78614 type:complete len:259 (-) Transcript_30398:514-1290(-)
MIPLATKRMRYPVTATNEMYIPTSMTFDFEIAAVGFTLTKLKMITTATIAPSIAFEASAENSAISPMLITVIDKAKKVKKDRRTFAVVKTAPASHLRDDRTCVSLPARAATTSATNQRMLVISNTIDTLASGVCAILSRERRKCSSNHATPRPTAVVRLKLKFLPPDVLPYRSQPPLNSARGLAKISTIITENGKTVVVQKNRARSSTKNTMASGKKSPSPRRALISPRYPIFFLKCEKKFSMSMNFWTSFSSLPESA